MRYIKIDESCDAVRYLPEDAIISIFLNRSTNIYTIKLVNNDTYFTDKLKFVNFR